MRRAVLIALFVVSGAAALCYEVAWTRHLVLVFGNTTRAVALLLGAWMLGLALGSEAGGRLADRTKRPAFLYAVFEIAIAAFALAFPLLVDAVRAVYLGIGTSAPPVLFLLAFLVLVIPTFCMGTTLPLLARATVRDAADTGRDIGTLYAANIVGAVAGAGLTGFVLMESAGVLGATQWAAAANAVVGVVGWWMFRGAPASSEDAASAEAPRSAAAPAPEALRLGRAALASAFVAGLVGLAAQVVWTRLLTFFLQGFTWTFSAILTTFLAGLALGGWVFGRVASRAASPARLLVLLHLGVAVAAGGALWALGNHHGMTRDLWETAGSLSQDLQVRHRWMLLMASGVILVVPAFLMGGCFPVASTLFQRGLADLGSRVGRLYAVNTVGCVLGSLVAGFVLQPLLGPAQSAAVVVFVAFAGAVVVAAIGRVRGVVVASVVALAACVAFDVAADPGRPFLLRSHVFAGTKAREVELVSEQHGEVCTVSVVRNVRERYDLLYTDEFEAAGTKPEYRYMRMLAHLPIALAEDPSKTLVICFGTGTTSGSVAAHSAVRELDIVEISDEVLQTADAFRDVNHDVLHGRGRTDLTVRVHVDDGRHHVLRSKERWGVITLEPLMPYTPAAIHFYTEDFYRICADRLAPGGLMCQWIPLQGMSGDDFKKLVSAFVVVYPDSAMFFVDGAVALIGGPQGVTLSWPRVSERLADPRVADDLRTIGFANPARALATYVAGGAGLREFAAGVDPVTDERPVLEFHPIPPGVALPWLGQNLAHMKDLRGALPRIPVDGLDGAGADKAQEELLLSLRSGNHVLDGMLASEVSGFYSRAGKDQQAVDALGHARASYGLAAALDPGNDTARRNRDGVEREWWTLVGHQAMERKEYAAAERAFRRGLEYPALRQADSLWTELAECRNRMEKFEAAVDAACEAVRLHPGGLDARCERAFARAALGDVEGAAHDYLVALRGASPETLPARLRSDAERALAAHPAPPPPRPIADGPPTPRGKLPERALWRIAAGDDRAAFAAAFAGRLEPPTPGADETAALATIRVLELAAPEGVGPGLARWVRSGLSSRVVTAAAEALARTDAAEFCELLGDTTSPQLAPTLAAAAAWVQDRRAVPHLLRLMESPDAGTRRLAHHSLFALVGTRAPGLDTLDTGDGTSAVYRRAVLELRSWWARNMDEVEILR